MFFNPSEESRCVVFGEGKEEKGMMKYRIDILTSIFCGCLPGPSPIRCNSKRGHKQQVSECYRERKIGHGNMGEENRDKRKKSQETTESASKYMYMSFVLYT